MGLSLNVDLKNGPEVMAMLGAMGKRAHDLRAVGVNVGEELKLRHKRRLAKGVGVHGQALTSQMSKRFGSEPLGGAERSFGTSLGYATNANGITFFSTFKGARVAQEGLTIKPKNSKFLTIPLRSRGGVFDLGDSKVSKNRTGKRARDYKDSFFRWVRGRLFLFQKLGSGRIRALFILLRSVKYPKNEWFGLNDADQDAVGKIYLDHVAGKVGE